MCDGEKRVLVGAGGIFSRSPSGGRAREKLKTPNREFSIPPPPSFLVYSTVRLFFLSLDEVRH